MTTYMTRALAQADNDAAIGDTFLENNLVKIILGRTSDGKLITRNSISAGSNITPDVLSRITLLEARPSGGATAAELGRIATLEANQLNDVAANKTLIRKPLILLPSINNIPTEIQALNPVDYTDGEIVEVEFYNGSIFYKSNGTSWLETDRKNADPTELRPTQAGTTNKNNYVYEWIEGRIYYGVAITGNENLTMPLSNLSARSHWTLMHTGERLDWHQAIAHLYAEWQSVFVASPTANAGKGDKLKYFLQPGSTVAQRRVNPTDTTVTEANRFWKAEL